MKLSDLIQQYLDGGGMWCKRFEVNYEGGQEKHCAIGIMKKMLGFDWDMYRLLGDDPYAFSINRRQEHQFVNSIKLLQDRGVRFELQHTISMINDDHGIHAVISFLRGRGL